MKPKTIERALRIAWALLLLASMQLPKNFQAWAGVATDGTVGPARSLAGPEYQVPHHLGTLAGDNLFHSFQTFSIFQGESATFTGPDAVANVVSRVTGGEASTIDGLLRSLVGTADFFLINPAGVMFGPDAAVDVPAAFHVSAADQLGFDDGAVFSAADPEASTLTMAEPASFGYLSSRPGDIVLEGSYLVFTPGNPVSVDGANVTMTGTETGEALLFAQEGEIRITAVGEGALDLPVSGDPAVAAGGTVRLHTAAVSSSGYGPGKISIRAGTMEMADSVISAENIGSEDAPGGIDLRIGGPLLVTAGRITSAAHAQGGAGSVTIDAGRLEIDGMGRGGFTGISSQARRGSQGDAGSVALTVAGRMELRNGGAIASATSAQGRAGDVTIRAGELILDDQGVPGQFTGIASSAQPDSTGDAGAVDVGVDGMVTVRNGAQIHSATLSQGDAGPVTIRAGHLRLDDLGTESQLTAISSEAVAGSTGDASSVDVTVDGLVEVYEGAQITSATSGDGRGGDVTLAAEELKVDGRWLTDQFTGIHSQADPGAQNDAGTVDIRVDGSLEILNGGVIGSATFGTGTGGAVTIRAGTLRVDAQGLEGLLTGISSSAGAGSTGDAGTVGVTVDGMVEVRNGAGIGSVTDGSGKGGDVAVRAGALRIDGEGMESQFTGISSSSQSGMTGDAGTVDVAVDGPVEIRSGGQIASATNGQGAAGTVTVRAGRLSIDDQGLENRFTGITTSTQGIYDLLGIIYATGDAGTVEVQVDGTLHLADGARISSESSSFSIGNAGNVSVRAGELFIDGQGSEGITGIDSRTHEFSHGHVGNVRIAADAIALRGGGEISIAANPILPEDRLTDTPDAAIEVDAGRLHLAQGSRITAESTGNVPAAPIEITVHELVVENGSRVTTSANEADGGPITIGGESMVLRDGLITTSVEGLSGDGGDIAVTGPAGVLVLDGGFIQANTAAQGARGGDIFIDVRAVIAEGGALAIGGRERQAFEPGSAMNIIQAAAPGGEQGTIAITAPDLDISGALVNLAAAFSEPVRLATNPCVAAGGAQYSSLVHCGRGGLPPDPENASAVSLEGDRLDGIMSVQNRMQGRNPSE